jgi:hypothetical protein
MVPVRKKKVPAEIRNITNMVIYAVPFLWKYFAAARVTIKLSRA